jgi:hypothetical protein
MRVIASLLFLSTPTIAPGFASGNNYPNIQAISVLLYRTAEETIIL